MTTEQFETNSTKCGLHPIYGEGKTPYWREFWFESAFDRHAYLNTTADGVTWATLRDDEPLSARHGSVTKPLAEITDEDFHKILGMKQ